MAIRRACYVTCDVCGDPAEVSTTGVRDARSFAATQGFKRVDGEDLCGRHWVMLCNCGEEWPKHWWSTSFAREHNDHGFSIAKRTEAHNG